MSAPDLKTLQRWMARVIAHPERSDAAAADPVACAWIDVERVRRGEIVRGDARLDPMQRLDVYNGGYLSRLIEVLGIDYDALRFALGDERWHKLAADYVFAHPSRHPNLNRFGQAMPAFVATQGDVERRGFLTELAHLQWSVQEAFDAPEFTPLDLTTLAGVDETAWATMVLTTNPSLRLLKLNNPANAFLQGFFDGDEPHLPGPRPTYLSIYRRDGRVWRTELPEAAFHILTALRDGRPFGEALEAAEDAEIDVGQWFQEWSANGVFTAAKQP